MNAKELKKIRTEQLLLTQKELAREIKCIDINCSKMGTRQNGFKFEKFKKAK